MSNHDGNALVVGMPKEDPPAVLFRAAAASGAIVRKLTRKRRSLEDVFLAMLEDD